MNKMLILSMARMTIDNHDDDENKHTQCRMSEERGLSSEIPKYVLFLEILYYSTL